MIVDIEKMNLAGMADIPQIFSTLAQMQSGIRTFYATGSRLLFNPTENTKNSDFDFFTGPDFNPLSSGWKRIQYEGLPPGKSRIQGVYKVLRFKPTLRTFLAAHPSIWIDVQVMESVEALERKIKAQKMFLESKADKSTKQLRAEIWEDIYRKLLGLDLFGNPVPAVTDPAPLKFNRDFAEMGVINQVRKIREKTRCGFKEAQDLRDYLILG